MNFLKKLKTYNIELQSDVSLLAYTAFRTESEAQFFYAPTNIKQIQILVQNAKDYNIPITVLGGGTNVLPPTEQIKGLLLTTSNLCSLSLENNMLSVESGYLVRELCVYLANRGKKSIDFLYGMPGTIGGACWMNARCYEQEISEVLVSVEGIDLKGDPWSYTVDKKDFSYKLSPFQKQDIIITKCTLKTEEADRETLWQKMFSHEFDRRAKGHYLAPCAGSVFKNNRKFGMPSGKLLDELGFRGKTLGDAMVNPIHANIIINAGNASAKDIYHLSLDMKRKAQDVSGFNLEFEIQLLGEESQWEAN